MVMMEGDCYYEVLGVARDASLQVINHAYKKLALKYHPDKAGGRKSHEMRFQRIQQAVEVLRDADRRRIYDDKLSTNAHDQSWEEWMNRQIPRWEAEYFDWKKQEKERSRAKKLRRQEGMRARVLRDEYELRMEEEMEGLAVTATMKWAVHPERKSQNLDDNEDEIEREYYEGEEYRDENHQGGEDDEHGIHNGDKGEDDDIEDKNEESMTCNSSQASGNRKENSHNTTAPESIKACEGRAKEEQLITRTDLQLLIPFFNSKLNGLGTNHYSKDDLTKELMGVVLESIQGFLEEWRLSIPGAQSMHTANSTNGPAGCRHLGPWGKTFDVAACEACYRYQPLYILTCPGCGTKACVICKFEVKDNGS